MEYIIQYTAVNYTILILWFFIAIAALVVEVHTAALVSAWFIVGSFCSMIVAAIWPTAYVAQVIVFVVVSILSLWFVRPILKNKFKIDSKKQSIYDSINTMIGYKGFAETEIDKNGGKANINGTSWDAVSEEPILKGSKVIVTKENNILLTVKKGEYED